MDLERLKIDRGSRRKRGRRGGGWTGRIVLVLLVLIAAYAFRAPLLALLDRLRLPTVQAVAVARVSAAQRASAVAGTAANGYVVARRRAALSADTPGRIVAMNVEEGTVVKKGDVVARLYADEDEAALRRAKADVAAARAAVQSAVARVEAAKRRQAEAGAGVDAAQASRDEAASAVELAQKEYDRVQGLLATGAVPRERFDQADAGLVQARARLAAADADRQRAREVVTTAASDVTVAVAERDQASAQVPALEATRDRTEATLEKTYVRAPFDGVIVLKDAEVGEVVSPNAQGGQSRGSVATMVDFASLEVQVELPETSLSSVAEKMPADVFLDAFPSERFTGHVLRIWPTANRQKATIEIRIGLDRIDPRMRPEMGARVVFAPKEAEVPADGDEPEGDVLVVPSSAIVEVGGRTGAFVIERDRVRFRPVKAGAALGSRVVVEDGLEEGERVVRQPPPRLADGDRVNVQEGS